MKKIAYDIERTPVATEVSIDLGRRWVTVKLPPNMDSKRALRVAKAAFKAAA